jgi:maltose O-acetyltransferase
MTDPTPMTTDPGGVVSAAGPGRLHRGLRRLAIHLMNHVSNLLGDDLIGKQLRLALLRAFGAQIGKGTEFHGGTWFSNPRNLRVGTGCFINRNCYFDLEAAVTLGNEVGFGHGTTIITTSHQMGPSHRRGGWTLIGEPVVIETGTWLGANVTVMPGVTVSRGVIVGAGALVNRDVEPDVAVAGVPARKFRDLPVDGPRPRQGDVVPAESVTVRATQTGANGV